MKLPRRIFLQLAAGVAAFPALRVVSAQDYPSRPITMVVPTSAGGPVDMVARMVAERMKLPLGQPVIIENVTGAAGSIGVGRVARSAPDGYTLILGFSGTHVFNGAIQNLSYDVLTDFEPITMTSIVPHLIVTKAGIPSKSLEELLGWLRANQDKVSTGMGGTGSPTHLAAVLFQKLTGIRLSLVPYRGTAPALQALMAGHIDLMFDVAASSLPHLSGGKIKAYAVASPTRLASAPDIPTVDEAGLPRFYMSSWNGVWAPRGTPKEVISRLNAAIVAALAEPGVRKQFAAIELEIPSRDQQSPEGFGAFQKAEIEKWWPIIKAANIRGE
jgi:tripartite-type tricarboxylate transporter receptor subunit TctC